MKRILTFLLLSLPLLAAAQKTHTVAAKESFYSIGRMYNVHPRELATYNNIPFEKGLSVGQVIKIPGAGKAAPMPDVPKAPTDVVKTETVKATPVKTESAKPVKTAGSGPVYHTVAPKEGLYSISKKYNASIADLKKWNNLSGDGLTIGANLIVGYGGSTAAAEEPIVTRPVPEIKEPVVKKQEPVEEVAVAPKPVVKEPVREVVTERGPASFNGGYFKAMYNQQKNGEQDKGEAGIFKSSSGWDDGKYYCLHNSAPAGSFVKITNTANNKSVYAKVLDLIPDLKQNSNVVVRISNAAASELGVSNGNFDCSLSYSSN